MVKHKSPPLDSSKIGFYALLSFPKLGTQTKQTPIDITYLD